LLPLIAGGTTWLVAAAVIGWLDLRLTLSSGPIVAQTVVLCMPAACHLAMRYRQTERTGLPRQEAARQTLGFTLAPVFWCALTAACGYLAVFLAASVLPVMQMGLIMFLTNLVAGVFTFTLSAAIMTGLRPTHSAAAPAAADHSTSGIGRFTAWVIAHPVWTLLLFSVPCLLLAVGTSGLRLETDYIRVYRPQSRVAQDYRFVEERMGGIGVVEIVAPAPGQIHVEWLSHLQGVGAAMMREDPEFVLGVFSLADVLSSATPAKDPKAAELILQTKLNLLTKVANAQALDTIWNRKEGTMRLLVRIRESTTAEGKEQSLARLTARAQAELAPDAYVTGPSYLTTHMTRAVVVTAMWSAAWSCLIILAMLTLALRSIFLAILAFTPTLLALGLVLGIMGWLDLKIDMTTALVAGIAVGLSVDDAFHCLLHWQHERRRAAPAQQALLVSYAGSGPGVILSSSAVTLGFLALMFGEFLPMATFGWLVAVATLGGSIGNLVFIPACIALFSRAERQSSFRSDCPASQPQRWRPDQQKQSDPNGQPFPARRAGLTSPARRLPATWSESWRRAAPSRSATRRAGSSSASTASMPWE
jgi:predicted RND superfamily exporter protein